MADTRLATVRRNLNEHLSEVLANITALYLLDNVALAIEWLDALREGDCETLSWLGKHYRISTRNVSVEDQERYVNQRIELEMKDDEKYEGAYVPYSGMDKDNWRWVHSRTREERRRYHRERAVENVIPQWFDLGQVESKKPSANVAAACVGYTAAGMRMERVAATLKALGPLEPDVRAAMELHRVVWDAHPIYKTLVHVAPAVKALTPTLYEPTHFGKGVDRLDVLQLPAVAAVESQWFDWQSNWFCWAVRQLPRTKGLISSARSQIGKFNLRKKVVIKNMGEVGVVSAAYHTDVLSPRVETPEEEHQSKIDNFFKACANDALQFAANKLQ